MFRRGGSGNNACRGWAHNASMVNAPRGWHRAAADRRTGPSSRLNSASFPTPSRPDPRPRRSPGLSPAGGVRPAWRAALLAGLAVSLLAAGTLVYLLDRPAGSAWLLPAAWQSGSARAWFGAAGQWLPSFAHTFGFGVLTALCLPWRPLPMAAACATWAAIDTLAEIGQHPAWSSALAQGLARATADHPLALQIGRYFTRGAFDAADVAAGLAGAALAYGVLRAAFASTIAHGPCAPTERSAP